MFDFNNKMIILSVISILILTSIPSISQEGNADLYSEIQNVLTHNSPNIQNHTILVEVGSSQGCSGCHSWNTMIFEEYLSGTFDFHFIEMIVYDHSWDVLNNISYNWSQRFGISSYPTTIFDGGFKQQIGSNPEVLQENLLNCQNREVSNITAVLNVTWIGQSLLNISLGIVNNENYQYSGRIRSHITEIDSRYTTNGNDDFHYGFLDFAFDENISIPAHETYNDFVIWDGAKQYDEHGDFFDDLLIDNVKVFLGVFDDKGFCDESVGAIPYNILGTVGINQPTSDRGFPIRHAIDGDWAGAQNVIPIHDTLTRCELYLRSFGTPEFDLSIELRENHPQGTLLDTIEFTPNQIPSSWEWFEVDFQDLEIMPGMVYFIVIPPAPNGVSTSFGYEWGFAFGDVYSDGAFWFTRDGGILWRDLPTMYDFAFRTYGY